MQKINWNLINFSLTALLGIALLGGAYFFSKKIENKNSISEEKKESAVVFGGYRGQVEYIEGEVEKRVGLEGGWMPVGKSELVSDGQSIRTLEKSRAVITFEDGSIARLDENTSLSFISAKDKLDVVLDKGTVFNNVAKKEDRVYSVISGDFRVVAVGTVFSVKKETESQAQVMVVESAVEVLDKNKNKLETIENGNRAKIATGEIKKENISEKDFQESFVAWNIKEDKLEEKIKEKSEKNEDESKEEKNESEADLKIGLSGEKSSQGVKLRWSLEGGNATHGFKIIKSKDKNPVYPGDDYQYLSDGKTRSYEWKINTGERYYFRVCVYLENGKCGIYSNNLLLETPVSEEKKKEEDKNEDDEEDYASKVSLSGEKDENAVKLKWSIDGGGAPNGFKVVKSKKSDPVYPGDDYQYLSDKNVRSYKWSGFDDGDKYYFRVCIYKGGKCGAYSNNVIIDF